MRKASFNQEIIDGREYFIGFVYFVRSMILNEINDNRPRFDEMDKDFYIITTSRVDLNNIQFNEWYECNNGLLWEFSKEFIQYLFDEIVEKFHNKQIHIIYLDGYFPLANTKATGLDIKEVIKNGDF